MSTVDKMLIKGIRSFDPENKHVITFFKPLTLLVGPNGAGKTTIIECLKLSCTGELPPNARSGHSFIHDPKVAGETETKGQIKLRFKTAAGKDVVCIRSFQLTQKASKMEYKAIESVLQTINPHTGEKVCLSYRCADMDREIPALMGVSKAVLENVIFVHQDEANWPLQDSSTLKKKFDDIFSATRYTKALEVIKKLHKDQAQEIRTYKLKLENLQTLKDAAYKVGIPLMFTCGSRWAGETELDCGMIAGVVMFLLKILILFYSNAPLTKRPRLEMCYFRVQGRQDWNVTFTRNFNDWEMDLVVSFLNLLQSNIPAMEVEDGLWWKLKKTGRFDTRSYYEALRDPPQVDFPWKSIWRSKAPRWVSFFVWTAAWNKPDHLLIHCSAASVLWCWVFRAFGIQWVLPGGVADVLRCWWNGLGRHSSDVWNLLREGIAQDQEKTESLKIQMQELDGSIQNVEAKIHHTEATLKDLRKLQDQIATKTVERSTLFKEQQKRYAALAEENEDTDEELKEWKTEFEKRIARLESQISKLEREMNDTETKTSIHNQTINEYIREISKLQTEAEAHMSLKNERDTTIQKVFARHNLGSLPNIPFSNEVALSLINRIKSRLMDLEKDMQDKKISNENELKTAWDHYMEANDRWKNIEAQKQAKLEIKTGILKRIEEKENERDSFELQLSNVNLSHIDEKENKMCIEVERKQNQLAERDFDSNIRQKQRELYSIEQEIKTVDRNKDIMAADSEDRVKLSLKKAELENHKKKHKKIIDEYKDRIRGVLKGRLPLDKDLKKEITQALRPIRMEFDDLNTKSREAEKDVNMLQIKIEEVNNNLSKYRKDMECKYYSA
uniref:DNA repair protein RAD50 n=1 Tax=Fagus sylvatica TaxID=28930 RepID=A0A2N9HR23_FAGSY